jgi:hypothetical protein
LEKFKGKPNILTEYNTANLAEKTMKLLINKKVDAMLSLDGSRYDAIEMGISDQISFIPILEQDQYDVGHITAPKGDWGKAMIQDVNRILRKELQTEAFFQFFTPLVDEAMIPVLRKKYDELIITFPKE